jgi:hypothetical protein
MRLPKTLLLIAFVAAITLSVVYNTHIEHFADSSTVGTAVGVTVAVVAFIAVFFAFFGGGDSVDDVFNAVKNLTKNKRN